METIGVIASGISLCEAAVKVGSLVARVRTAREDCERYTEALKSLHHTQEALKRVTREIRDMPSSLMVNVDGRQDLIQQCNNRLDKVAQDARTFLSRFDETDENSTGWKKWFSWFQRTKRSFLSEINREHIQHLIQSVDSAILTLQTAISLTVLVKLSSGHDELHKTIRHLQEQIKGHFKQVDDAQKAKPQNSNGANHDNTNVSMPAEEEAISRPDVDESSATTSSAGEPEEPPSESESELESNAFSDADNFTNFVDITTTAASDFGFSLSEPSSEPSSDMWFSLRAESKVFIAEQIQISRCNLGNEGNAQFCIERLSDRTDGHMITLKEPCYPLPCQHATIYLLKGGELHNKLPDHFSIWIIQVREGREHDFEDIGRLGLYTLTLLDACPSTCSHTVVEISGPLNAKCMISAHFKASLDGLASDSGAFHDDSTETASLESGDGSVHENEETTQTDQTGRHLLLWALQVSSMLLAPVTVAMMP